MMLSLINKCKTGDLFIVFFIMLMFLPRIVKKGLFGDGLLYASMSRNMSEGIGSFWKPYFSSSYWLENMPSTYFENPPLMIWLQSLLFSWTGDHWWVEKLFSILVLIINLNLFRFLWITLYNNNPEYKKYWYLVVFFWYIIPVVIWGNVNNLLDNLLLSFCLAAVAFLLISIKSQGNTNFKALIAAGVCIFLGVLTKGPVALYPLAVPFVFFVTNRHIGFNQMLKLSILSGVVFIFLFVALIIFEKDALYFFEQYWEQRLKAVIVGSRDDMKLNGWTRMYILYQLAIELLPTVILTAFGYIIFKIKRWDFDIRKYKKDLISFLFIGFAATLPIIFSTKQSGIYLIPGIPMFSVAAAILSIPMMEKIKSSKWYQTNKFRLKIFFAVSIPLVVIFSAFQFGKPGREIDLMHDIEILKNIIPKGSKIGVCEEMKKEFVLHTYLQRMGKYELIRFDEKPTFILKDQFCLKPTIPITMYEYDIMEFIDLKYFQVFRKKQ